MNILQFLRNSLWVKYCLPFVATGISLGSLKFFPGPYIWIGLIWFMTILYYVFISPTYSLLRTIGFYGAVIIMTLTLFEGYLWCRNGSAVNPGPRSGPIHEVIYPQDYRMNHDALFGYSPPKNSQISSVYENTEGELIYRVTYTIDERGLRRSPPDNGNIEGCGVFFGGSFTYGDGVNDDETMPYQVGILTEGSYRIYNFGYTGYGPHQMLSALEHGLVKQLVACDDKPTVAIYQAMPNHIQRATGLASWDLHGPRYVMTRKGKIHFAGNFDDHILPLKVIKQLNKSLIYTKILGFQRSVTDEDVTLFAKIVDRSRRIFQEIYPDADFQVIFWDNRWEKNVAKALDEFERVGIRPHLISKILPDYVIDSAQYVIPEDGHPTARTHEIIAAYVVEKILEESSSVE